MGLFSKKQQAEPQAQAYFLSLGAGQNQAPLLEAAHQMGYQTIAVDKNTNAPAFKAVDLHMYSSVLRPKKILAGLQKNMPLESEVHGIGCRSYGRATLSTAILAEKLSLPGAGLRAARLLQNKIRIKDLAKNLEIPTAPSYILEKTEQKRHLQAHHAIRNWQKRLPLIARPIMGHAKQGLRYLGNLHAMRKFLNEHSLSASRYYLLDKYIEGREVTVMGFVEKGTFILLGIIEKHTAKEAPHFIDLAHSYPFRITSKAGQLEADQETKKVEQSLCRYMQSICDATQINYSPILGEFLIAKINDKPAPYLIECIPETGGEYLADYLLPTVLGRSYFHDLVRIYTGQAIQKENNSAKSQVRISFIPQKEGRLQRLEFPKGIEKHPNFLFASYLKKEGDYTSFQRANLDRLAVFALQAPIDSQQDLAQEAKQILQQSIVEYY